MATVSPGPRSLCHCWRARYVGPTSFAGGCRRSAPLRRNSMEASEWIGPVGDAWAAEWQRTDRSFADL
ncbi:hypothetical protein ABTK08_20020, partial [Acinetobacter baumannii]